MAVLRTSVSMLADFHEKQTGSADEFRQNKAIYYPSL
jgi:hypothetical protein